ncbi:hypothetical protein ACFY00_33040 [Kitasatospora sp. NPDC001540]|uniref:hypothetical protein n=1 Tax=Kitasatospora sp. NPDC001540 TaxID=3364014 RepID=UPI0036CED350
MPSHPSVAALYPIGTRIRQDSTHRAGSVRGYVADPDVLLVQMDRPAGTGGGWEEVRLDDLTRLPSELPLDELIEATITALGGAWISAGVDMFGAHKLVDTLTGVTVEIPPSGGQDDDLATLTLFASDGEFCEDSFLTLPSAITLDAAAVLLRSALLSATSALLDDEIPLTRNIAK